MDETMKMPRTIDFAAPVNYLRAAIRGKANKVVHVFCKNIADRLWDEYLEPNYELALGITLATHDYSYKPPYKIDWDDDDDDDTPPFGDDDQLTDYGQMRPIDYEAARIAHEFEELDDEDLDVDFDELFHSDSWEN